MPVHERPSLLYQKFPPSEPCTCDICIFFCRRPGWWLVSEAREAIDKGYADRMMLEFSPDFSFAVLSPAFRGNEAYFALQEFAGNGCTFLKNDRCVLFQTGFQPIECRFCHHARQGLGSQCHAAVGMEWSTGKGKRLVKRWLNMCGLSLQ